ncbi:MAG: CHAT domain-containing tetratricopeptide repeat protein, partial [Catalinimonas sp.]
MLPRHALRFSRLLTGALLLTLGSARAAAPADSAAVVQMLNKGVEFEAQRRLDSALASYEQAKGMAERGGWTEGVLEADAHRAMVFCYMANFDSARAVLDRLGAAPAVTRDTTVRLVWFEAEATLAFFQRKLDRVRHFQSRALRLKKSMLDDPYDAKLGASYNNMALVYDLLGDAERALACFDTASVITFRSFGRESAQSAALLHNMAEVMKDVGLLDEALDYTQQALRLKEKTMDPNSSDVAYSWTAIGRMLARRGDHVAALAHYRRAMEIHDHNQNTRSLTLANTHDAMSGAFEVLGRYDEALAALDAAEAAYRRTYGDEYIELTRVWGNRAQVLATMGRYAEAEVVLDSALRLERSLDLPTPEIKIELYVVRGDLFRAQGRWDESARAYQTALAANHDLDTNDLRTTPPLNPSARVNSTLLALRGKAEAWRGRYGTSGDAADLTTAAATYQLALDYVRYARTRRLNFPAQRAADPTLFEPYEPTIATLLLLYERTDDPEALAGAYRAANERKAADLINRLQRGRARAFAHLPDSVRTHERDLLADLGYLEKQRYEQGADEELDARIFALRQEVEQLERNLERNHPGYYQLKYAPAPGPAEIQRTLRADEWLVEYVWSDSLRGVFLMSRDAFTYRPLSADTTLDGEITALREAITARDEATYITTAVRLYDALFAPVAEVAGRGAHLTVVPDGPLNYLPFDALLSAPPRAGQGYRDLPYVLRDYTIGYRYAARLPSSGTARAAEPAGETMTFAGFAPAFEQEGNPLLASRSAQDQQWGLELTTLPFAQREVTTLATRFGGNAYTDRAADEATFKAEASRYRLLHIASHALLDDENPLYSKLVFASTGDTTEDNLLHTYELYNLALRNTAMVCLSACNTGLGK